MVDAPRAQLGDLLVIHGHGLAQPSRTGEILEVLGTAEHEHHRVRWDDGRESIFTPGSDAVIRHARHPEDEPVPTHEP